jgi:hypothetical protein
MEELRILHSDATEVDIATVEELAYHDTAAYRMGGLLITSVFLKDVGLVG